MSIAALSIREPENLSQTIPRSLFAVLIRGKSDDATEQILDAIDKSGIDDSDWDWVVWSRGTSVYSIISAPMLAKGALAADPDIRMLPVGSVTTKMEDNRNDWIYPRASRTKSALEIAEKYVTEWVELQFIVDEAAKAEADIPLPSKLKERTRIASRSELMTRSRRKDSKEQQLNTAAALGLDSAKDSAGRGFTFTKLSE